MSPAYRSNRALAQTVANQGVGALPRVPASEAIARFAGRPAHFLRRCFSVLIRAEVRDWNDPHERPQTDPRLADPEMVKAARELGFKYVGVIAEIVLLAAIRSDLWLDPERISFLRASMRQERIGAVPVSVYHLATYFEDGSCVLTWSHSPRTTSTKNLASRTGKGNLRASFFDHQAFVCQWAAERNTRALAIDRPESIEQLVRHYYRQLAPLILIIPALAILALPVLFAIVIAYQLLATAFRH